MELYHFNLFNTLMSTELVLRYIITIIANPTATSAAASAIMKNTKTCLAHEPQVQRCDIRVSDKDFRIVAKDLRLEIGKHSHRAVSAGAPDDRLDPRVEPHAHEIGCAALILVALKSSELRNVGIEDDLVTGALERLHSAHQWALARRVRRSDYADGFASGDCRRTNETLPFTLLKSDRGDLELFVCRQR